MSFEREYRDLSFVPRWSIIRQIHQQSVADHSFYVALYSEQFARLINWQGDMGELLKYALYHDVEECFMGDIVGPVKRAIYDRDKCEKFKNQGLLDRFSDDFSMLPSEEVKAIVKIADGLDEMFYLGGEIQMGNQSIVLRNQAVRERYEHIIKKLLFEVFNLGIESVNSIWDVILVAITNNSMEESMVQNDLALK